MVNIKTHPICQFLNEDKLLLSFFRECLMLDRVSFSWIIVNLALFIKIYDP